MALRVLVFLLAGLAWGQIAPLTDDSYTAGDAGDAAFGAQGGMLLDSRRQGLARFDAGNAGGLEELKTHFRGAQIVLRSKTPQLVKQEFYGLLMAHFAVRGFMHEAALQADEDPDRRSFLHSVRVVQRRMARFGAIPPSAEKSAS